MDGNVSSSFYRLVEMSDQLDHRMHAESCADAIAEAASLKQRGGADCATADPYMTCGH
jgi:hypothetical protein